MCMLSFNHVFDISCHVVCLTFYLVLLSLLILLAQKTLFSARRLRSTFMSCFSHVLGQRSERKLQSQRMRVTPIVVIHFSALGMMAYFLYIEQQVSLSRAKSLDQEGCKSWLCIEHCVCCVGKLLSYKSQILSQCYNTEWQKWQSFCPRANS